MKGELKMGKEVTYVLSLKDMLSSGLIKAEEHAKKLESGLSHVSRTAGSMMGAIGMSIAFEKTFEFAEKSIHAFHQLHEQESILENTLANVGARAHMSAEQMTGFAQSLHKQIPQNVGDILQMENSMARFNITNQDTFQRLIKMSADISVSMKRSGADVSEALGMIFENPMLGMRKLMALDIRFTQQQQGIISHLVQTGKLAKAQELIFASLGKRGFEGAAAAAAAADPLKKLHDSIYDIQIALGSGLTSVLKRLAPAFNTVASAIQDTIRFMKDHRELMEWLLGIGGSIVGTILAVAGAVKAFSFAQSILNLALNNNPIAKFVTIAGILIGVFVTLWEKSAKFRATIYGLWGAIKEFGSIVADVFSGIWHVIHGVFSFNPSEIKRGYSQAADAMYDSGLRIATSFKSGYDKGLEDFATDHAAKNMNLVLPADKKPKGLNSAFDAAGMSSKPISKGTGQKNVHIDIKIGALISGGFQVHTTNIKESYDKIRDHVTSVLMSAINDSQVVAEH